MERNNIILICLWIVALLLFGYVQFCYGDATIYDKNWERQGTISDNGTIYDKNWNFQGKVERDGTIYDKDWNRVGKIEDNDHDRHHPYDTEEKHEREYNVR